MILSLFPIYFYRRYIFEVAPVEYTFKTFYWDHIKENISSLISCFYVGVFYAFKLFWLYPIIASYYYFQENNKKQLLFYFLIISGALSQMIVAYDTSRLMGLAFPLVIFSAIKINEKWGTELFIKRTFFLILVNFLIPQFCVWQSTMTRFYSLPTYLLKILFWDKG